MKLSGKKILVVGLGKTGISTAVFLKKRGADVIATDSSKDANLFDAANNLSKIGINVELGVHNPSSFMNSEIIVLSPGVAHTIDPVANAARCGAIIMGEIELASRFIKEPIVAITGTNGKTTTTTLIGKMLEESGLKVFVGGNIGNPLIDYIDSGNKADIIVAEISSFQLDTIDVFRPKVSVLLNISEDHLDRYPDFNAYTKSKMKVFKNQKENDYAVFNASDKYIFPVAEDIKCSKLPFFNHTAANNYNEYAKITDDRIVFNLSKDFAVINQEAADPVDVFEGNYSLPFSAINLLGKHNMENVAAATLASFAAGGNWTGIKSALKNFTGLAHRIEYITTINEVKYYNDSKATTVDSVIKALEVFNTPVILIMGGRDKGSNFGLLADTVKKHVKRLIAIGEAKEKIKSALGDKVDTILSDSLEDAIFSASRSAESDDVVLLSPACSSFDMFKSYAHRGEIFREEILKIAKTAGND
ncbi:MAG: UDP-N-acetylmuramoyl-L-alanine--D-glutamate ligase [Proteobacteria bacterium]|nr:UDP-N-acetylmuramoyl-L-alanine--D-glutamate ligase [Pseudomonadota bacterium]